MRSLLHEAIDILRSEGPTTLFLKRINYVYRRTVAPVLPRRSVQFNSIDVPAVRLFDRALPWRHHQKDRPNYESGLIAGIERNIDPDDDVIIVGGGWGVTAVKAAYKVGKGGTVTVYEGSAKEVDRVRRTAETNGYSDIINVKHAIVGTGLNLRGDSGAAAVVNPEELPQCDVLELDCEGSEIEILEEITIRPDVILVETHGQYDASTDDVKSILSDKSYSVVSSVIADRDSQEKCINDDIRVLTAIRNDRLE